MKKGTSYIDTKLLDNYCKNLNNNNLLIIINRY